MWDWDAGFVCSVVASLAKELAFSFSSIPWCDRIQAIIVRLWSNNVNYSKLGSRKNPIQYSIGTNFSRVIFPIFTLHSNFSGAR